MFSKRPDGKLCKNIDPFMKIIPYIMFQRNDAMNFNFQEIDCTGLDEFCRREKSKELGIGYMQLTMAAIVRSISSSRLQPSMSAPRSMTSREQPAANFLSLNFFLSDLS